MAQVLIFSRAVRMLKLVQAMVTKHGWASEYLDGGTPEVC
jgi:SNF2 family DNA or RNA helicase